MSNQVLVTEKKNTVVVNALVRAVGNATIGSDLDITNTIGDALAGGTYEAGTTLETIVRDLISPFLEPAYAAISWSASGAHEAAGEDILVECGLQPTASSINITWSNPENVDDASDVTVTDMSAVPNLDFVFDIGPLTVGDMPYAAAINYTLPVVTTQISRTFRLSSYYLSQNGTGPAVELVKNVKAYYRHRTYVVASTSNTITGVAGLLASAASTPLSTLALAPGESNVLAVNCDAGTAGTDKYTWILIPIAATLSEVAAEVGGLGVADYTESFVEYNNSGSGYPHSVGTASPAYKAYRSRQPGAFDSDVTLKLTITH